LSIVPAWDRYSGEGVTIAVCDDGVELDHPDIEINADKDLAFDFLTKRPGGAPVSGEDAHGTSCAGLAAARANNGIGITGAAPAARLTSLRIVGNSASPADEARAMAWRRDVIAIKSNSWGPPDDGFPEALPAVVEAAMKNAVKTGRDGRGTIFVWAGGNGKSDGDNSNYDGYANSIYTIAIGAVSPHGGPAYYSEPGANLIASAPSDNRRLPGVTSTDLRGGDGYNGDLVRFAGDYADADFTKTFGGTSAAAPQIAGVIALMLEANPRLGWRDVQEILIRTAVRNDRSDPRWVRNAAGLHFNELYGAGVVQASAAARMARTWKNLPAQRVETVAVTGPLDIPDGSATGRTLTFAVSDAIRSVEHVVVEADIAHPFRGDLEIELISPGGTRSTLAEARGDGLRDYDHFKFMSVRNWGEAAAGTWSVIVRDRRGSYAGSIRSMKLAVHGTGAAARTGK
jgi:subtilisin family serine protease